MYAQCYKCGGALEEGYPSHLCFTCRQSIHKELPASTVTLADRLTADDLKWLDGMQIKIDEDMIKK